MRSSHSLDRLETAFDDDRRAVIISPTAKARRVLHRGRRLRIETLAAELEALPPADIEALERAVDALRRLETGPQP